MRTKEQQFADYNWPAPSAVARMLGGVSAEHVIRLVKAGELRARNVAVTGTRYRIDPESVEDFKRRRAVGEDEAA